jgi:hypothetical protein
VGIPLNLLDRSLEGDFDLLVAMQPPPKMDQGRCVFPSPIYRSFELKTAKITRTGDVTSLKLGKFHKTIGQLQKLCDIGAQQVFLLEAFIIEAGYSTHGILAMPQRVREAVADKYEQITRAEYGYVAMAIEQIPDFAEEATGIVWPTVTLKSATTKEPSGPFLDIIKTVEDYIEKSAVNRARDVVTYCYNCRKLTHTHRAGPYWCRDCESPFV